MSEEASPDAQSSIDLWCRYCGTPHTERGAEEKRLSAEFWKGAIKTHVVLTVVSQTGTCAAGLKAGRQYDLDSQEIVLGFHGGRLCPGAFYAAYPYYLALKFGASPWYLDSEATVVACPDPKNRVVLELRRVQQP